MIKKILNNDIVKRALKTFIQGMLAVMTAELMKYINTGNFQFDEAFIKSLIIGGLAGGFSALMNFILNLLKGDK